MLDRPTQSVVGRQTLTTSRETTCLLVCGSEPSFVVIDCGSIFSLHTWGIRRSVHRWLRAQHARMALWCVQYTHWCACPPLHPQRQSTFFLSGPVRDTQTTGFWAHHCCLFSQALTVSLSSSDRYLITGRLWSLACHALTASLFDSSSAH